MQMTEHTVYRFEFAPRFPEGLALTFEVPARAAVDAQVRLKTALESVVAELEAAIYHLDVDTPA